MMNRMLFFLLMFQLSLVAFAQEKNLISNESFKCWPVIKNLTDNSSCLLSNNGKFIVYKYGEHDGNDSLVIKSISGNFIRMFKDAINASFTYDSKRALVLLPSDSLVILTLESSAVQYIPKVKFYSLNRVKGRECLMYIASDQETSLIFMDISGEERLKFNNIIKYQEDANNKWLIMDKKSETIVFNMTTGEKKVLSSGKNILNPVFDPLSKRIAFILPGEKIYQLCLWDEKKDSISILMDIPNSRDMPAEALHALQLHFTPDGNKIILKLPDSYPLIKQLGLPNAVANRPEIWNYQDKFFPPSSANVNKDVYIVFNILNRKYYQLNNEEETVFWSDYQNEYCLSLSKHINDNEFYWNSDTLALKLVSLDDGTSKIITRFTGDLFNNLEISRKGKFVLWFDEQKKCFCSYNIKNGSIINISAQVPVSLYDMDNDLIDQRSSFGVGRWLYDDSAVIIYDKYDIWKVDPLGLTVPINLTKGMGRKMRIVFRTLNEKGDDSNFSSLDMILTGFNVYTKESGFWKIKANNLEMLTMGPYKFEYLLANNIANLKMAGSDDELQYRTLHIVKRMSSRESPNLFWTSDFRKFTPISNIHPELNFNWIKSELVNWKLPNGRMSQGILYKPENFDSTCKYPMIFNYYEKRSDGLNLFIAPRPSNAEINIPYYVSNGYLVFVPDIHYKSGQTGQSARDCIVSAAEFFSRKSWVNKKKLGLQGHSFGGFETLYVISHSNLFSAAQVSAGVSNQTSIYNHLIASGNRNRHYDRGQGNMRTSPWAAPLLYIRNSPYFYAKSINTPLLIMHNRSDIVVPFQQGVDMFAALRRMRKKVWLLQYDKEGHTIFRNENNILDFNIRQQQFFDYYLKDKPCPKWMALSGYKGRY